MKHFPIATIHNNRYRGPIETRKSNDFYNDVEYNLNYLKETYAALKDRSLEIDNIIKNRSYNIINDRVNNIIDFIERVGE